MFSQHPFTLEDRCSLDASLAFPVWKRALDLIFCVAALPLLALLTLVFALMSIVYSRGPVFYRQQIVGPFGRSFGACRFRTMHVAAPVVGQPPSDRVSQADGPPVMLGGRFLRASGLADLPQIVNVLRGEMSVVGTRPVLLPTSSAGMATQRNDSTAMTGLTGVWRFRGTDAATRVRWEQTYAGTMSLRGDLKVIARTLIAVMGLRTR